MSESKITQRMFSGVLNKFSEYYNGTTSRKNSIRYSNKQSRQWADHSRLFCDLQLQQIRSTKQKDHHLILEVLGIQGLAGIKVFGSLIGKTSGWVKFGNFSDFSFSRVTFSSEGSLSAAFKIRGHQQFGSLLKKNLPQTKVSR